MEGAPETETSPDSETRTWTDASRVFAWDTIDLLAAPNRRNLLHWLSWAVTLAIALSVTVVLSGGRIYGWEQEVTREFQAWDYPEWAFRITSSSLADPISWQGGLIMASVAVVLLLLRYRVEAALVVLIFPLHVLGNFPKAIIDRERPSEMFDGIFGVGGGMSFPSGHAEYSVTFFGFLAFVTLTHLSGRFRRTGIVFLWIGFAILGRFRADRPRSSLAAGRSHVVRRGYRSAFGPDLAPYRSLSGKGFESQRGCPSDVPASLTPGAFRLA